MKITIFLIILEIWFKGISGNENILSKFHQSGYKVKEFRLETVSYNEKYFNKLEVKTFKYNRTTPAVNATMNLKIAVKDKMEVIAQVYKFLSNEYRHFPIRLQLNVKQTCESNALGLSVLKNCGNLESFTLEKDKTYDICNFIVDETRFPPLIPNGRYRIDLQFLYFNDEMAYLSGFGEIYTPIEYPNQHPKQ